MEKRFAASLKKTGFGRCRYLILLKLLASTKSIYRLKIKAPRRLCPSLIISWCGRLSATLLKRSTPLGFAKFVARKAIRRVKQGCHPRRKDGTNQGAK